MRDESHGRSTRQHGDAGVVGLICGSSHNIETVSKPNPLLTLSTIHQSALMFGTPQLAHSCTSLRPGHPECPTSTATAVYADLWPRITVFRLLCVLPTSPNCPQRFVSCSKATEKTAAGSDETPPRADRLNLLRFLMLPAHPAQDFKWLRHGRANQIGHSSVCDTEGSEVISQYVSVCPTFVQPLA